MKKVMLFIASMLFAVSASAATINVTGIVGTNSMITGEFGATTPDSASVGFRQASAGTFSQSVDVSVSAEGDYIVEWGFNKVASVSGAVFGGASSLALNTIHMLASSVYNFTVTGLTSVGGTRTDFTVSAVPVPAALFLFAPALLGFFGLRRKATALAA